MRHSLVFALCSPLIYACTPLQTPFPMREDMDIAIEGEEPEDGEPEDGEESEEEVSGEADDESSSEDTQAKSDGRLDGAVKRPRSDAGQLRSDGAVPRRSDASTSASTGKKALGVTIFDAGFSDEGA